MGADRPVKKRFLTAYDYGQGARWAYITADSSAEIVEKYPELEVIGDRPTWMDDETHARIVANHSYDIDEEPRGFLAILIRYRDT